MSIYNSIIMVFKITDQFKVFLIVMKCDVTTFLQCFPVSNELINGFVVFKSLKKDYN